MANLYTVSLLWNVQETTLKSSWEISNSEPLNTVVMTWDLDRSWASVYGSSVGCLENTRMSTQPLSAIYIGRDQNSIHNIACYGRALLKLLFFLTALSCPNSQMFQNVAYRPTVYKTGIKARKVKQWAYQDSRPLCPHQKSKMIEGFTCAYFYRPSLQTYICCEIFLNKRWFQNKEI